MYMEFLIEDASGGVLIGHVMEKYKAINSNFEFRIHSFKGIGYPKMSKLTDDIKTKKLLTDLPIYLRGISKQIASMGADAAIVVVVDNDRRNCEEFKKSLLDIQKENMVKTKTVFCIATEEMEAWLLGDRDALLEAYPKARLSVLSGYTQDAVVGTWELMADVVYQGGLKKIKKDCPTYREIGGVKCEWANRIGASLNIERNISPSFRYLIRKLDELFVEKNSAGREKSNSNFDVIIIESNK